MNKLAGTLQLENDRFYTRQELVERTMTIKELVRTKNLQGYTITGHITKDKLLTMKKVDEDSDNNSEDEDNNDNFEKDNKSIEKKRKPERAKFFYTEQMEKMLKTGRIIDEELTFTDKLRLACHPDAYDHFAKLGIYGVPIANMYNILPHQETTLKWMRERERISGSKLNGLRGGMVSLTMGLGKTLTAVTHILSNSKGEFPTLVVTSLTIMNEWKTECIEKFFGDRIQVLYLHKNFNEDIKNITRKSLSNYQIVLTTYDLCNSICKKFEYYESCLVMGDEHTLMKDKIESIELRTRKQADLPKKTGAEIIYCTPWHRVICDESQRYANPKTKSYRYMMALYGDYKWCLTGTPIRNYMTDIWAQLRFLGYNRINKAIVWNRQGRKAFKDHGLDKAVYQMTYEDAGIVLPNNNTIIYTVELSGNHRKVYDYILGVTKDTHDEFLSGSCSFVCVLAMFIFLRQVCIAPHLLLPSSKKKRDVDKEKAVDTLLATTIEKCPLLDWMKDRNGQAGTKCAKIVAIINTLFSIPKGEKCIIFSTFSSALDLIYDAIEGIETEFTINGESNTECPICLEKLRKKNTYILECNHCAHPECLKGLIKPECPLCREKLIRLDDRILNCIKVNMRRAEREEILRNREAALRISIEREEGEGGSREGGGGESGGREGGEGGGGNEIELEGEGDSQSNNNNNEIIDECYLCKKELTDDEYVLQCNHCVHLSCLKKMTETKCPQCKIELGLLEIKLKDRIRQNKRKSETDSNCNDVIEIEEEEDTSPYRNKNIKCIQVDGTVTGEDRTDSLEVFKNNPDINCLLMSYKVGSEGLNLTVATHCFFLEPWWTPAVHNQALARLWRMGQKQQTFLHKIIAKDTIERRVLEICQEKEKLTEFFTGKGISVSRGPSATLMRQILDYSRLSKKHNVFWECKN